MKEKQQLVTSARGLHEVTASLGALLVESGWWLGTLWNGSRAKHSSMGGTRPLLGEFPRPRTWGVTLVANSNDSKTLFVKSKGLSFIILWVS